MDVGLVCDACSALTPIGVPQCARCGAAVALDPRPRKASTPSPPQQADGAGGGTPCPKCGTIGPGRSASSVPNCGSGCRGRRSPTSTSRRASDRGGRNAGARSPARRVAARCSSAACRAGRAREADADPRRRRGRRLVHARGRRASVAGRGECPISFPDDPFLSPTHANFRYRRRPRARSSSSATRARSTASTCASPAPRDLDAGHHHPRRRAGAVRGAGAAARGRPRHRGHLLLGEHDAPGDARDRPAAPRRRDRLGVPPERRVRSRSAARATTSTSPTTRSSPVGTRELADRGRRAIRIPTSGSRNGTFVRVTGERVLKHGDYVFLGQQLLRVEIV